MNLENNITKLEGEKQESVNKLSILTKFFKEQEKEYLKYENIYFLTIFTIFTFYTI